jgi:hypothetical protein
MFPSNRAIQFPPHRRHLISSVRFGGWRCEKLCLPRILTDVRNKHRDCERKSWILNVGGEENNRTKIKQKIDPLNAELNPMCHLLILLGDLTFMGKCIVSISNKIQRHTIYFLSGNCSTCFGWYFHPSSGAHTTVCTASGICHTVAAICRYRGRVETGLSVLGVAYATHSTLHPVYSEHCIGSIFKGRPMKYDFIDLSLKMEPLQCSETSAISTQTPGKHPKENILHLTHGESLKSRQLCIAYEYSQLFK